MNVTDQRWTSQIPASESEDKFMEFLKFHINMVYILPLLLMALWKNENDEISWSGNTEAKVADDLSRLGRVFISGS